MAKKNDGGGFHGKHSVITRMPTNITRLALEYDDIAVPTKYLLHIISSKKGDYQSCFDICSSIWWFVKPKYRISFKDFCICLLFHHSDFQSLKTVRNLYNIRKRQKNERYIFKWNICTTLTLWDALENARNRWPLLWVKSANQRYNKSGLGFLIIRRSQVDGNLWADSEKDEILWRLAVS